MRQSNGNVFDLVVVALLCKDFEFCYMKEYILSHQNYKMWLIFLGVTPFCILRNKLFSCSKML